ncbi:MAG TPA: M23 family metallopeptidase [Pseudomonas sp.]|nr:M23 family metallopeptidase [Pseudomonas sp.]
MQIILLGQRNGAARSLSIDARLLSVGAGFLALLILAGGIGLGNVLYPYFSDSEARMSAHMEEQRAKLSEARLAAQRQLDAFGVHLAEMQARLTRLDALGERLTELAKLDTSEFDFSLSVGQGGPEELLENTFFAPPPFLQTLDELMERLSSREQQLEVLEDVLADRRLSEAGSVAGRPVTQGYLSSPFGRRTDPFTGKPRMHRGVDFAAREGTDVVAVAAGVVTWSGRKSGYGTTVEINHGDGYVTLYAHNRENLVRVGELVQRGQAIAKVGSSGRSTGPHVHFEVIKDGRQVNPYSFIARAKVNN